VKISSIEVDSHWPWRTQAARHGGRSDSKSFLEDALTQYGQCCMLQTVAIFYFI
jgi:hypothetical protein